MTHLHIVNGKAAAVITFEEAKERGILPTEMEGGWDWVYENPNGRGVLNNRPLVEQRVTELREATGKNYILTDAGEHCTPRFDIMEAPQVGDFVSYGFNGDCYPDGTIVRISASLKVITLDTGSTYYRKGETGCWKKKGGTWSMVKGNVHKQNREF